MARRHAPPFPRHKRGCALCPRVFPEAQGWGRGIAPRRIPPFTSYLLPFTFPRHSGGCALPPRVDIGCSGWVNRVWVSLFNEVFLIFLVLQQREAFFKRFQCRLIILVKYARKRRRPYPFKVSVNPSPFLCLFRNGCRALAPQFAEKFFAFHSGALIFRFKATHCHKLPIELS